MKNKTLNLIAIFIMMSIIACTSNKANTIKQTRLSFAPLKERNAELAKLPDWALVKSKSSEFFNNIYIDSTDIKSKLLLAQLYMQEARITGEHPYYYPAAMAILDHVIRQDNQNFEAHAFKASVLLSLHHFKEALEIGTKAANINSQNGFIYGILCDANVELGNYEEAVKMSDKMQAIRPGLESYSRASYLREIYGDNIGAIEAMKMAFQAGLTGSEEAAWAGNTLSQLLENKGDLKSAEDLTLLILQQRPGYPFAINALGQIELSKGNFEKAIAKFDEAIKIIPEVSFYENKAKALKLKGEIPKANEIYKACIAMLTEDAKSGHYVDMEMAHIYMELGNYKRAKHFAETEYKRRPLNIDVNHCMALVYTKIGDYEQAKKYMNVAMRMGTNKADLWMDAALIEKALGNSKRSNECLIKARKANPSI
jgi:tetratricopeptide (TPR) repeat protein